jgi:hypothetical protein
VLTTAEAKAMGLTAASKGKPAQIKGNALESWTSDPAIAQGFAQDATFTTPGKVKVVVTMQVPRQRVVGTARTGFGCLNESEYVLSSGRYADTVIVEAIAGDI